MDIVPIYILYVGCAIFAFWWLPVRSAILLVFFGGWLLLPVGNYPIAVENYTFPYWITGLAVPSLILINKSWIVPTTIILLAILFDRPTIRGWRPTAFDIPILLWCIWPLITGLAVSSSTPGSVVSSLYLLSSWGFLWLLGRVWFSSAKAQLHLIKGIIMSGVACLPFALIESINQPFLYEIFYQPHPYRYDGIERYFGFRPIGFFEHGNQYGIWVVISAIAAIWLAKVLTKEHHGQKFKVIAVINLLIALASQSVGAIILGLFGLILLAVWSRPFVLPIVGVSIAMLISIFILHISNVLPLEYIARQTEMGQMMISFMKDLGRGSFFWRIAQDIKSLYLIHSSLLFGLGTWDWWQPINTRPWGLAILIMGQFGIVGSTLAFLSLVNGASFKLIQQRTSSAWSINGISILMSLIVFVSVCDALLNSFLYFPALIVAGALHQSPSLPSKART